MVQQEAAKEGLTLTGKYLPYITSGKDGMNSLFVLGNLSRINNKRRRIG
jgi:hypothetical protein